MGTLRKLLWEKARGRKEENARAEPAQQNKHRKKKVKFIGARCNGFDLWILFLIMSKLVQLSFVGASQLPLSSSSTFPSPFDWFARFPAHSLLLSSFFGSLPKTKSSGQQARHALFPSLPWISRASGTAILPRVDKTRFSSFCRNVTYFGARHLGIMKSYSPPELHWPCSVTMYGMAIAGTQACVELACAQLRRVISTPLCSCVEGEGQTCILFTICRYTRAC